MTNAHFCIFLGAIASFCNSPFCLILNRQYMKLWILCYMFLAHDTTQQRLRHDLC